MSQIRINFSGVQTASEELACILRSLDQLQEELAALQKQIAPEVQRRRNIFQQLHSCQERAAALTGHAQALHRVVCMGADQYREAESFLFRSAADT